MKKQTIKTALFFGLLLVLFACASPEKLIDRAIKRDPSIVNTFSDTVTLQTVRVDSVPFIVDGEIRYRDTIITEFRDTVINCNGINIERKKTRFEIRKNFQLQRRAQDLQFRLEKLEKKNDKLQAKLNARSDRKEIRQDGKTERTKTRKENKKGRAWLFWLGVIVGVFGCLFGKYAVKYLKSSILKEKLTR